MRLGAYLSLLALFARSSGAIVIHVHGNQYPVDIQVASHERWSWTALMTEVALAMRVNGEHQSMLALTCSNHSDRPLHWHRLLDG